MRLVFILCFLISNLFADESHEIRFTAEAEPLTTVAGCVNALTGDFFLVDTDFVVGSVEPLQFTRIYDSGHLMRSKFGYGIGSQLPLKIFKYDHFKKDRTLLMEEREGFHLLYEAKEHKSHELRAAKEIFERNITNCSHGSISGKTNLRNTKVFRTYDSKYDFRVELGDGTKRYYKYKERKDEKAFFLVKEEKPNATEVYYTYRDFDLKEMESRTKSGLTLGKISFDYKKYNYRIQTSQGHSAIYYLNKSPTIKHLLTHFNTIVDKRLCTLSGVKPTNAPRINYQTSRNKTKKGELSKIEKVEKPQGQFLEIVYDDEMEKVTQLKAPVGPDHKPIVTHAFEYKEDHTVVTNAQGHQLIYRYSKDNRLQSIDHLEKGALHHSQKFVWNKDLLLAKAFCSKGGKAYNLRRYEYDKSGNVLAEHLYGNLSGNASKKFAYDLDKPTEPTEEYTKEYTYTEDGFNLLSSEKDPSGLSIEYQYLPHTNLLKAKLIKSNGLIVKRLFNTYNEHFFLVQTIEDDGCSSVEDELHAVTERRVMKFEHELTNPAALGKIKSVKQLYLNLDKQQEELLQKIHYTYDGHGQLIQEDLYDCHEQFVYSLKTTFTKHGLVKTHIDAIGREFRYDYDENDNKIQEELVGSGKVTHFKYDYANRLISKKELHSGLEFEERYLYNTLNQMIAKIDMYGHQTDYEYDTFGRLIKTTLPAVQVDSGECVRPILKQKFDASGNLILSTDARGFDTQTTYTAYGKPIKISYPDGGVERFEYYLNGHLFKHVNQLGAVTDYTYDPLGNVLEQTTTDPQGTLLKKTSNTYKGYKLLTTTDARGVMTEYRYDHAGRKIEEIIHGDSNPRRKTFEYDNLGRLYKTLIHLGDSQRVEVQIYDHLNRVIEERVEEGNGVLHTKKHYVYDIQGQIKEVIQSISDKETLKTKTKYLPNGLPYLVIDSAHRKTQILYDYKHENGLNQRVLKRTTVDPMGNQIIEVMNTGSQVAFVEQRDPNNLLLSSRQFYYDQEGQLKAQKEFRVYQGQILGEFQVTFEYDCMGRLIRTLEQNQKLTTYEYNHAGDEIRQIKPDGNEITLGYDTLGRVVWRADSFKTIHEHYHYDQNDNLLKVEDFIHHKTSELCYNGYNELIQEKLANGLIISYDYDALGRPLALILPDDSTINYSYNALGLVQVARLDHIHTYQKRDLSGKLLEAVLPKTVGELKFSYDSNHRLKTLNAPSLSQSLSYDSIGNLLELTQNDSLGNLKASFSYDSLYQLKSESGVVDHTYECDSLNNHLSKNGLERQHSALNELKQDEKGSYTYDSNGNLLSKPGISFVYDGLNRLIEVHKDNMKYLYSYDFLNRRLSKALYQSDRLAEKEDYLYQGQSEIAIFKNSKLDALRVLGLGTSSDAGAAVLLEINNKSYIPIHNHRGDLVSLIDTDSKVAIAYRYEAYGLEHTFSEINNPWRYASKHFDTETGFIYFGERYYDPTLARWINPDPAGFVDGLNTYAYVMNNPMRFLDAYGLSSEESQFSLITRNTERPENTARRLLSMAGMKEDNINYWVADFSYDYRIEGALQAVGGLFEVASGASFTLASGGVGAPISLGIMAHGFDQFSTGMNKLISNKHSDTFTSNILQKTGLSPNTANLIDNGISVFGSMGANASTQLSRTAYKGFQLSKPLMSNGQRLVESSEHVFQLNRFHYAAKNLSKSGQNNIRILRNWAKSKGWKKLPNSHGGPEIWGTYQPDGFVWNLRIKPVSSFRSGLHDGSGLPRFDARLGINKPFYYINPFNGISGKRFGTHIPLE